ncbi:hypothetical protein CASFOL_014261 [Castilleja foliolosa]|uniref:Dof zinc finger protein n=1 Tax=Castilleja foliolosa TaxID=1961234 RepID=A0ABD3DMD6_9LAMI
MEQGRTKNQPPLPPRRRPENHMPPPPAQKCPRCDSSNTKFCYYNNYSLSQPRYFCKACRRYWTHGGTLRNVPVGGGCRKSKRPKPSPSSNEIARSQPFSVVPPHQNSTAAGLFSGQALRVPIMPSMGCGNSFYTGGALLSSLATMNNSLPAGINIQGHFDHANMALLQNLQTTKQNDQIFQSQQSLNITNPSGPGSGLWTQSFIRGSASSSAGPSSSYWSRDGENQARLNSFNNNTNGNNNH